MKWWFHGERENLEGHIWWRCWGLNGAVPYYLLVGDVGYPKLSCFPWSFCRCGCDVEFSGSPRATSKSNSTAAAKPSMHILEETSWSEPTWCKHCGGFLWGVYRRGGCYWVDWWDEIWWRLFSSYQEYGCIHLLHAYITCILYVYNTNIHLIHYVTYRFTEI